MKESHEEWRPVEGYEDTHAVSNIGRIKSINKNIVLSLREHKRYLHVTLYKEGTKKKVPVHRLVAKAFLGLPSNDKTHVNHLDGNRKNNKATNLEWQDIKGNNIHYITDIRGIKKDVIKGYREYLSDKKENTNPINFLTVEEVKYIKKMWETRLTKTKLAEFYGVSLSVISNITTNKTYDFID